MSRPDETTKQLAAKIARALFTEGGTDRRAARLVMEHLIDGRPTRGAGWSEMPMADRIAELLHDAQLPAPRPKGRRR